MIFELLHLVICSVQDILWSVEWKLINFTPRFGFTVSPWKFKNYLWKAGLRLGPPPIHTHTHTLHTRTPPPPHTHTNKLTHITHTHKHISLASLSLSLQHTDMMILPHTYMRNTSLLKLSYLRCLTPVAAHTLLRHKWGLKSRLLAWWSFLMAETIIQRQLGLNRVSGAQWSYISHEPERSKTVWKHRWRYEPRSRFIHTIGMWCQNQH